MTKRKRILILIVTAAIVIAASFAVVIYCVLNPIKPPADNDPSIDQPQNPADEREQKPFAAGIYNQSKVGYSAKILGTVQRKLPETSDGGLDRYPKYGVTLTDATTEEKQAIIAENGALVAGTSTYDAMDEDGNLYLGGEKTGKKLYKHSAAVGLYEGNVSDDEQAVVKQITIKSRPAGNHLTGLYAPAGEVIKIELSAKDLAATGGVIVRIGQALQNGQANNIWDARDLVRMPNLLNTMTAAGETTYVGSFLGGPIYVQPVNAGVKFTVTISGAVPYSHYIHGYTTREEFEENARSSAPYFDLEVWDDSVRHSGPKARAAKFDYDQITEAAVLWDKISRVSNEVPSGSVASIGITFLYDPFVAAGSMVAFVGRSTVNCPLYCMTAALDAETAVNNAPDAFWGCIHEYNHHYQRYGFNPGDEVTNNAVSLVSYSLFTRISANRAIGNANEGNYAVGWNRYTNPSWSLKQTLANTAANSNLDSYANILHAFGQTAFLEATKNGSGADNWYKSLSDVTKQDMTYYFTEILHQTVSDETLAEYAGKGYPAFVPIASIYQTGRSYVSDGEKIYSRTAQPYEIESGEDFTFDIAGSLVIPSGFTAKITKITQPEYGKLAINPGGGYTYSPDGERRESGKIIVTLKITKDDGAFEVDDVDLVIELRQKQYKSDILERTVYTYAAGNAYNSPTEAYERGYAGYETVTDEDNTNPTQNANTDIWVPNPTKNAIMEVRGKFYVPSAGKYRLAIRGRNYAALYVSLDDGKNYELAANMTNLTNSVAFDTTDENNYSDYDLGKGQWVYFREVLLVTSDRSFVGLGLGKFDGENVSVSYLGAKRNSYERETFESEYFLPRAYAYDYHAVSGKQTPLSAVYEPWDDSKPIDLLFDDDDTNWIHSGKSDISAERPFEITADLGETMLANRFTIYGEPSRQYQPKDFKLYGGTSLKAMELIADVKNAARTGSDVIVEFAERRIKYYRLVVTDTWATTQNYRYIAFRCAKFSYSLIGGKWLSPDDGTFGYFGEWKLSNELSTFGHLYEGEKDSTLEFAFDGARFAIFGYVSADYDGYEVLVDGVLAGNVKLGGDDNDTALIYLSENLGAGKHEVTIRGSGRFNIDSVVLWE